MFTLISLLRSRESHFDITQSFLCVHFDIPWTRFKLQFESTWISLRQLFGITSTSVVDLTTRLHLTHPNPISETFAKNLTSYKVQNLDIKRFAFASALSEGFRKSWKKSPVIDPNISSIFTFTPTLGADVGVELVCGAALAVLDVARWPNIGCTTAQARPQPRKYSAKK